VGSKTTSATRQEVARGWPGAKGQGRRLALRCWLSTGPRPPPRRPACAGPAPNTRPAHSRPLHSWTYSEGRKGTAMETLIARNCGAEGERAGVGNKDEARQAAAGGCAGASPTQSVQPRRASAGVLLGTQAAACPARFAPPHPARAPACGRCFAGGSPFRRRRPRRRPRSSTRPRPRRSRRRRSRTRPRRSGILLCRAR
jgi:hypothetical protein